MLIEWPEGKRAPIKYWFSTLPADMALDHLVETAKLHWRIERDDQELKQELGLDHYEGRSWRGFHDHDEQAALTAVEPALDAGAPTKTHILNLLHRLVDGKPTDAPPAKPPSAPTLNTEPQANVERYDALRNLKEAPHASVSCRRRRGHHAVRAQDARHGPGRWRTDRARLSGL